MRDTILFDINETVLDLAPMRARFAAIFPNDQVAGTWFSSLLHSSVVTAITGVETRFSDLAWVMLDHMAARHGMTLTDDQRDAILTGFSSLPPHPDVMAALNHFRHHGYRTVAFTNSSFDLVNKQLSHANLITSFDEIISVEATGSFKPDPKVYAFAAKQLARPISSLRLIATHDWDTHGALHAGMLAGYVDRMTDQTVIHYHPLYKAPDCMAHDLVTLAEMITAADISAKSN